jgi:opacity protein-like surface antigen
MRLSTVWVVTILLLAGAGSGLGLLRAQGAEVALTVGEVSGGSPNASTPAVPNAGVAALNLNAGVAVGFNYAHKIRQVKYADISWEIEALGSPLRYTAGTPVIASHEVHAVFVTPGAKMTFMPKETFSPWISAGGGYAFYDSSSQSIAGGTTGGGLSSTGGTANTYAVDFGAGVDYAMSKKYVLRGEVRGFYTGNPNFGVPTTGWLFNFEIGFGLVWRR